MNSKRISATPRIAIAMLIGILGSGSVMAATESDSPSRLDCRFDAGAPAVAGARDAVIRATESGDYDRAITTYVERYSVAARSELSCVFPDHRVGRGDAMSGHSVPAVATLL